MHNELTRCLIRDKFLNIYKTTFPTNYEPEKYIKFNTLSIPKGYVIDRDACNEVVWEWLQTLPDRPDVIKYINKVPFDVGLDSIHKYLLSVEPYIYPTGDLKIPYHKFQLISTHRWSEVKYQLQTAPKSVWYIYKDHFRPDWSKKCSRGFIIDWCDEMGELPPGAPGLYYIFYRASGVEEPVRNEYYKKRLCGCRLEPLLSKMEEQVRSYAPYYRPYKWIFMRFRRDLPRLRRWVNTISRLARRSTVISRLFEPEEVSKKDRLRWLKKRLEDNINIRPVEYRIRNGKKWIEYDHIPPFDLSWWEEIKQLENETV